MMPARVEAMFKEEQMRSVLATAEGIDGTVGDAAAQDLHQLHSTVRKAFSGTDADDIAAHAPPVIEGCAVFGTLAVPGAVED